MNPAKLPVSLCMIVKNEEQNLERCLRNILNIIEDIVVVDTGSTDRTIEIAQNLGARVFTFNWTNDFAEARNLSISKAKYKIVLCLDADEEIIINDLAHLKNALTKLQDSSEFGLIIPIWSYTGDKDYSTIERSSSLRFFNKDCHYIGKIHEQPVLPSGSQPILLEEKVVLIKHYGYLNSEANIQAKIERNIQILEAELESDSKNPFLLYYLGNEHLRSDAFALALKYFNQALALINPKIVSFYSSLLKNTIVALMKLGSSREALTLIEQGLAHLPAYTDLFYLKGQINHLQQNFPLAISSFKTCIELGDPPCYLMSTHGVGSHKALYSLGMVYQTIGEQRLATDCFLQAIKLRPDFYYPIYNLIEITLEKGYHALSNFIETYFDTTNEHTLHQLVNILKAFNQYKLAAKFLLKLHAKAPNDVLLNYKLGLCYFYLQKPLKASTFLDAIPKNNWYCSHASKYKFLCRLRLKHYKLAKKELQVLLETENNYYPVLNNLYVLSTNKDSFALDLPRTIENSNLGLSLLEDLLIAKNLSLANLITKILLSYFYDFKIVNTKLIQLLLKYNHKDLAFSLLQQELNKKSCSSELLYVLKELVKDRTYLNKFKQFVYNLDSANNAFKRQMDLLLVKGTAIYILNFGLKHCPNSDTIKNQLELIEESFSKFEEVI